ncbi:MAG: hypothetical protein V4850_30515 [Myxococcota bacterium]
MGVLGDVQVGHHRTEDAEHTQATDRAHDQPGNGIFDAVASTLAPTSARVRRRWALLGRALPFAVDNARSLRTATSAAIPERSAAAPQKIEARLAKTTS